MVKALIEYKEDMELGTVVDSVILASTQKAAAERWRVQCLSGAIQWGSGEQESEEMLLVHSVGA